ncbi:hypothetical protein HF086_014965 [Spodoptera exigua]|uniref:PHD-type domain-containing protein n=1 Tax=Spodoptera exigua TaxID=7107 RepID=A0A922SI99_SPOEX|nr:hypothetical protein HF086_014965 [Spodoptera exigua]
MAKCGGCGQFMSGEVARCNGCSGVYHRRCVALPRTGAIAVTWQCPECRKNLATDNKAETPVRGRPMDLPAAEHPSSEDPTSAGRIVLETTEDLTRDIMAELRAFRDNLRSINKDMQLFRADIADIRSTLRDCQENVVRLEDRMVALEGRQSSAPLDSSVNDIIAKLRQDLNDRDQELLCNDVEIANLPETNGENPVHLAVQIGLKLGVKLDERDIVSAERVGARRLVAMDAAGPVPRPRLLAVRLVRRDLREEVLSSARARRGATSAGLGLPAPSQPFYVNERLTAQNRLLFRKAREAGQHHGWKFVWTKRGRTLARNKPGDKAYVIRCEADVDRIFGPQLQ